MYDIYLITNVLTGARYIGCTSVGYEKRFRKHMSEAASGGGREINKAIREYGAENFSLELIEQVENKSEAYEREAYHVKRLNTFQLDNPNGGYNRTSGGIGTPGHVKSEESREQQSLRMKSQGKWKGEGNPKFGKGYLMSGLLNVNSGRQVPEYIKAKIRKTNSLKFSGELNPQSINLKSYAKDMQSGKVYKAESFFSLQKIMHDNGVKMNRAMALQVMRGVRQHHHKHKFYREDITDEQTLKRVEEEYQKGILNPLPITDHRQGNSHPNAKNLISYSEKLKTGELLKFESWFDLKKHLEKETGKKLVHSNMMKVLNGKQKHTFGYKLYRSDLTNKDAFEEIERRFRGEM